MASPYYSPDFRTDYNGHGIQIFLRIVSEAWGALWEKADGTLDQERQGHP